MVRDDLYISVPSYFRCPISLDVMKSPVSLCTGITYDRSSIQRWLDGGNNTCPATMQVLQSKELIPNHTLQRLIRIWSETVLTRPTGSPPPPPLDSLDSDQAAELVRQLENDLKNVVRQQFSVGFYAIARSLSRLTKFAAGSEENRRLLADGGGRILPLLVSILGRAKDLSCLERIVVFCNLLLKNRVKIDSEDQRNALKWKIQLQTGNCDVKAAIMMGLKQGNLELRIALAKFLEAMAANKHLETHYFSVSEEDDYEIFSELLRLIFASDYNPDAVDASLGFLTRLVLSKRSRVKFVRAGGVKVMAAALSEAELTAPLTEKVLRLLEIISGCKEGRSEICSDAVCVRAIVKKLLKVSAAATEHAVAVLWSLCCFFGEKAAETAVEESNGAAKILLLLQSNCSPAVRQMCGDLLRVFKLSSKNSCVSWYDTKTTHIMPF